LYSILHRIMDLTVVFHLYYNVIKNQAKRGDPIVRDVDKHLKQEYEDWEKVQAKELTKLNAAMRHLCLNVGRIF